MSAPNRAQQNAMYAQYLNQQRQQQQQEAAFQALLQSSAPANGLSGLGGAGGYDGGYGRPQAGMDAPFPQMFPQKQPQDAQELLFAQQLFSQKQQQQLAQAQAQQAQAQAQRRRSQVSGPGWDPRMMAAAMGSGSGASAVGMAQMYQQMLQQQRPVGNVTPASGPPKNALVDASAMNALQHLSNMSPSGRAPPAAAAARRPSASGAALLSSATPAPRPAPGPRPPAAAQSPAPPPAQPDSAGAAGEPPAARPGELVRGLTLPLWLPSAAIPARLKANPAVVYELLALNATLIKLCMVAQTLGVAGHPQMHALLSRLHRNCVFLAACADNLPSHGHPARVVPAIPDLTPVIVPPVLAAVLRDVRLDLDDVDALERRYVRPFLARSGHLASPAPTSPAVVPPAVVSAAPPRPAPKRKRSVGDSGRPAARPAPAPAPNPEPNPDPDSGSEYHCSEQDDDEPTGEPSESDSDG